MLSSHRTRSGLPRAHTPTDTHTLRSTRKHRTHGHAMQDGTKQWTETWISGPAGRSRRWPSLSSGRLVLQAQRRHDKVLLTETWLWPHPSWLLLDFLLSAQPYRRPGAQARSREHDWECKLNLTVQIQTWADEMLWGLTFCSLPWIINGGSDPRARAQPQRVRTSGRSRADRYWLTSWSVWQQMEVNKQ